MKAITEARLVDLLDDLIRQHVIPEGYYTDKQLNEFDKERAYLTEQLEELDGEGAWWADPEWDWFLNRALDFLENKGLQ